MATSSDSFRPNTSLQEPSLPGLPRYHVSTREVAAEYEPPARGAVLGNSFGPLYQANLVLDAQIQPKDGKKIVTIVHCAPPNWHILLGVLDRTGGGGEHQYSQQVVLTPSQATLDADYLSTYDPIDETKSMKRTKQPRRKKADGTYEAGYPKKQTKTKGQDNLTPAKYRRLVTATETVTTEVLEKEYVNEIPTPANPDGNESRITHQKLNDDQYAKTIATEVIAESGDVLDGGRTSEWGILTSQDRVVAEGSAVPHAEGIARAEVSPFGNNKAEETVVYYPTPNGDGIIATLSDQDQDSEYGIITDINKMLVVNSESDAVAAALRAESPQPWWVEQKGQDQHHTVLIASKIDLTSLPADEEYWDSDSIRLPDRLLSVGILWGEQKGGGNGSGIDEGGNGFSGTAKASATASLSATIALSLAAGFSGRTKVRITRSYMYGPPATVVDPYNIIPVSGTVSINTGSKSVSCSVSKTVSDTRKGSTISTQMSVGSSGRVTQIGPFLNSGVVASGAGVRTLTSDTFWGRNQGAQAVANVSVQGTATVTLPTSTPGNISPGALVARYQVPKRWRLGVWILETIEVYAP